MDGRLAIIASWCGPERSFWGMLARAERTTLYDAGYVRVFTAGAAVMHEGESPRNVLVLISGYARVIASSPEGAEVSLALRGPGDVLGEMSVADGLPRSAAVVAMNRLAALIVPAQRFSRLLDRNPLISRALLAVVSGRLRDADHERIGYAGTTVGQRLVLLLVKLATQYGVSTNEGVVVTLSMTQTDLAHMIGGSREAVARGLRELRRRNIVLTGRRRIAIRNLGALTSIAELKTRTNDDGP